MATVSFRELPRFLRVCISFHALFQLPMASQRSGTVQLSLEIRQLGLLFQGIDLPSWSPDDPGNPAE